MTIVASHYNARTNRWYHRTDPSERFWRHVDRSGECWMWTGAISRWGYGVFAPVPHHAGMVQAHRFAYQDVVGEIPAGLVLDHLCGNRACVRPDHLEPVTQRENVARSGHGRETHCKYGHPLSGDNLYQPRLAEGRRDCMTCRRARARGRRTEAIT